MFPFRRKRARIIKKSKPDKIAKTETATVTFTSHIAKYIGKTVTVFVNAGGPSGCGFTGVLSDVDNTSLKLIIRIGPPPSCPQKNLCYPNCTWPLNNYSNYYYGSCFGIKQYYGFHMPQARNPFFQTGTVAHILLSAVTAFVHNSI